MDREEFIQHLEHFFNTGLSIVRKKNADYASGSDPFQNFKLAAHLNVPVEKAIIVRMSDKLQRIANLVDKEAAVADETIHDTLQDLSNYAGILDAYLHDKKV